MTDTNELFAEPVDDFDLDDARAFIARTPWRFAKSVPQTPHEYVVRSDDPDHRRFTNLIKREGWDQRWRYQTWRYLTIDGFDYWVSGRGQLMINRRQAGVVREGWDEVPGRWADRPR